MTCNIGRKRGVSRFISLPETAFNFHSQVADSFSFLTRIISMTMNPPTLTTRRDIVYRASIYIYSYLLLGLKAILLPTKN